MIGKTRHATFRPTMRSDPAKPRGVLRTSTGVDGIAHRRLLPQAALGDFVEHYWCVRWHRDGRPPLQQQTLPHPNAHLVIERGEARLWGVHDGRFERTLEGSETVFGVKFAVGGLHPFLRRPVATLTNRSVPARKVFGTAVDAIAGDIAACADLDDMAALVEPLLLARRPASDPLAGHLRRLVAAAVDDREMTSVACLAAHGDLEPRRLQRLFREYVGVSPKWVINRYRLHEAVARLQAGGEVRWAELALGLGYYDQAHFIRDFQRMVGQTPAQYARSVRPAGE